MEEYEANHFSFEICFQKVTELVSYGRILLARKLLNLFPFFQTLGTMVEVSDAAKTYEELTWVNQK